MQGSWAIYTVVLRSDSGVLRAVASRNEIVLSRAFLTVSTEWIPLVL